MPVYTFPDISPDRFRFGFRGNSQEHTSPLTASSQTLEIPSPRWLAELSFQMRPVEQSSILKAFLVSLRGRSGRFYLWNFHSPLPRGTIAGTPLVNGAGQVGSSLIIDGVTVGTTLLRGDMFGVNSELKMITADVTANGSGEMTLAFSPPLRSSPANDAPITISSPTAKFMLTADEVPWDDSPGLMTDINISCIEDF